MVVIVW